MRRDGFTQPPVEQKGRSAVRGGLLPVAVAAVGVGAVLVWSMAANDPYWRLFETPSVPAPAYESPEEIRSVLATAVVATAHVDSAATRPEAPADADLPEEAALALLAPRPAEPLIAVPSRFHGHSIQDSAGHRGRYAALDRTLALPAPPRRPVPPPAREADADGVELAALEPLDLPATPAPLWQQADSASEEALALARRERADVQRRLALAGFDPRGFDGVFGPRTRQAITDFQEAWGFPATGYLDAAVYADLKARTEEAYAALASRAAAEPRAAPKLAPVARERQLAAADDDGCTRNARGNIIANQSFTCDLKGLAEEVVSLGRNKLAHEEPAAMAGRSNFAANAGADR